MTNLRTIVESTLVPHTAFQEVSQRLEQCYSYSNGAAEPICLAVVGESRTGKSRVLEECFESHVEERTSEGLQIPVLRVKTPSKPTVKGLVELMLETMKDPKFDSGTENRKTARLRTLMVNAGTRMVMIDEFQHFYDKVSHKVAHHVADWLKILVDNSPVALVVAGLPSCLAVLEQNEQLGGRFLSPCLMPRFLWNTDEHREEFMGILGAFQGSLGRHFDLPQLDSAEMAFRCYCGTGGLIGYLTKFLRQAVWDALDDNRTVISLEHLAAAHDRSVWNKVKLSDVRSPFSRSFVPYPSEDLVSRIMMIGKPALEVASSRRGRRRKAIGVSRVLSAS